MVTSLKILLVDDHHLFVEGLKKIVETFADCEVVAIAHSGDDALYQLRRFRTDILLLDINMPGTDGFEVLEIIQRQQLPVSVIMLSFYDDLTLVKRSLKLGAKGYLIKNAGSSELEEAIRQVAAGHGYISSDVKRAIAYREDNEDPFIAKFLLSNRELDVVRLLAADKTSEEIADQLCVSPYTIDAVRKTLLKKLRVRSVAGIVSWAWRSLVV